MITSLLFSVVQKYSYTGKIRDDKKQELWDMDSGYKLTPTWVYGKVLCQYVHYGKKDRREKRCCFLDKGEGKWFHQDIVVKNEEHNGVAVDQRVVKGSVHKIVIDDVKAPAHQGDKRIFPPLMVYLKEPFPGEKKEKVRNPCSKS